MSTVAELFASVSINDVLTALYARHEDAVRSEQGYRQAWRSLAELTPSDPQGLTVVVAWLPPDPPFNDESYVDVTGSYDHEEEGHPAGTRFGLLGVRWEQWLACPYKIENADLSPAALAAEILWEMTWHGYDQDTIGAFVEEIKQSSDELDELIAALPDDATEEERNAAFKAAGYIPCLGDDDD